MSEILDRVRMEFMVNDADTAEMPAIRTEHYDIIPYDAVSADEKYLNGPAVFVRYLVRPAEVDDA